VDFKVEVVIKADMWAIKEADVSWGDGIGCPIETAGNESVLGNGAVDEEALESANNTFGSTGVEACLDRFAGDGLEK
jgi:hypothetical protein